ncbi:MAG: long-chain fatty acid--CoA ligase [Spirochaetales bacterium]|nr:long-chain fatty acid--CoA ligase [Spirochaetales bacterium]
MEKTLLTLFKERANRYSERPALYAKDKEGKFQAISFTSLFTRSSCFGLGLLDIGIKRGDHIGIISNNRKEWIIAGFGILGIGALDIPRGSDSMAEEILYILSHADCPACLVEDNEQFEKVLSIRRKLPQLTRLIVMDEGFTKTGNVEEGITVYTFNEICAMGEGRLKRDAGAFDREIAKGKGEDLATIIYTSGTTGEPKGVMLTHNNFLHQLSAPLEHLDVVAGDIFLSVLPVWHAFERSAEYVALFTGCSLAYSKLIGKVILEDMEAIRPTIFPSVPRIWESVRSGIYKKIREEGGIKKVLFDFFVKVGTAHSYFLTMTRGLLPGFKRRILLFDILIGIIPLILITPLKLLGDLLVFGKIKKKLGGRFKFGISGAGALPPYVDKFFAATGILLLEGYGLTEAAPIVSVRKDKAPVPNTIGPPLPQVEAEIRDPEGKKLGPGKKGILFVRGPNVMKGYYKRPEETEKVLSPDGWLNTGDLAMQTYKGELRIMGRVKETIVLRGGENIEPGPIEDVILQSEYIDQVMIVGQDQKYLGALVVPNIESLSRYAETHGIYYSQEQELLEDKAVIGLIKNEINERVNIKKGFKVFEQVFRILLLKTPFETGTEVTHTLKLKRDVIVERYEKEIQSLFS